MFLEVILATVLFLFFIGFTYSASQVTFEINEKLKITVKQLAAGTNDKTDSLSNISNLESTSVLQTVASGASVGIVGIIGYSIASLSHSTIHLFFVGLVMAMAAFSIGSLIGALFGMPKRNEMNTGDYSVNSSLVEISDWLSKIIVGVGLINLRQIPASLIRLASYLGSATGNKGQSSDSIFGICLIVYFVVLGLYSGYCYARSVLPKQFKFEGTNTVREEVIEANSEKQELKEDEGETGRG